VAAGGTFGPDHVVAVDGVVAIAGNDHVAALPAFTTIGTADQNIAGGSAQERVVVAAAIERGLPGGQAGGVEPIVSGAGKADHATGDPAIDLHVVNGQAVEQRLGNANRSF